jgi:hypothetical protein
MHIATILSIESFQNKGLEQMYYWIAIALCQLRKSCNVFVAVVAIRLLEQVIIELEVKSYWVK